MNNYNAVVFETLWLKYFNDTLKARGIISEQAYRCMNWKIIERDAKRKRESFHRD